MAMPEAKHPQFCCSKCGSTNFTEHIFRQYRQLPSSLPGGDLVSVTTGMGIRALICLCGHPVQMGSMRRQVVDDLKSFDQSFRSAVQYREGAHPQAMIDKLSASFAGTQQVGSLAQQIDKMAAIVAELPQPNIED